MKMKQRGYIDFSGAFRAMFVFGVIATLIAVWLIPFLWRLLKPWLHQITG